MSEALALLEKTPVTVVQPQFISLEEYFRREEKSLHKNEYHDGIIVQMAGAKYKHNRLAHKTAHCLESFIEANDLNFEVSNSDTKIRIEDFNKVVYPDAVVVFDAPQYYKGREDTIVNPILVVEVLSSSTKSFDRNTKFEMYRTLPSFKEYVLVHQDRLRVSVWTKQSDGSWLPKDYVGEEETAILPTLNNCPLPLAKLYKRIKL